MWAYRTYYTSRTSFAFFRRLSTFPNKSIDFCTLYIFVACITVRATLCIKCQKPILRVPSLHKARLPQNDANKCTISTKFESFNHLECRLFAHRWKCIEFRRSSLSARIPTIRGEWALIYIPSTWSWSWTFIVECWHHALIVTITITYAFAFAPCHITRVTECFSRK